MLREFYECDSKLQEDLENTLLEEGYYLKSALVSRAMLYIHPKWFDKFRIEFDKSINPSHEDIALFHKYNVIKEKFIEVAKYYALYTDDTEYVYCDYF